MIECYKTKSSNEYLIAKTVLFSPPDYLREIKYVVGDLVPVSKVCFGHYLFDINILLGEKFFQIDFDMTVLETIFMAEKVANLFPSFILFESRELKLITYDRDKGGELYKDIR